MTSKYGWEHKVESWDDKLNPNFMTLPQLLKNQNITTAFICAHYSIPETISNRINTDWSFYKDYLSEINETNRNKFYRINDASRVTKDVKNWLRENSRQHFFLWIHFMDPHAPYRAPQPYNKMYINDIYYKGDVKVKLIKKETWNASGGMPLYMQLDNNDILDYYISQYDGEINFVDANIGEMISYLKELNLQQKTAIIITADHGECLGDHSYYGHDRLLYDTLIKVPLITVFPWIKNKKDKVTSLVETIDIAPTILNLLGINNCPDFDGESLLPLITNQKTHRNKKCALCSTGQGVKSFALRTDKWKLTYNKTDNTYKLYYSIDGPNESNNLIYQESLEFKKLKIQLNCLLNKSFSHTKENAQLDKKNKELLRSLGYVQ